jgi:hypothetical protein
MGYLIDIAVGAAGSLLAAEVYVHAEPVARWLIRKAAARVPERDRERRQEEWLADLNDMPGAVQKLLWGVGCHWAATVANGASRSKERLPEEQPPQSGDSLAQAHRFRPVAYHIGLFTGAFVRGFLGGSSPRIPVRKEGGGASADDHRSA